MLAIYYGVPWVRWTRPGAAPDQAVMVDFAHGRFYFGPIHLWPQEVYFITGLLVIAAVGLVLSNALFGRLWCGYACPQTVWTDLYPTSSVSSRATATPASAWPRRRGA
jgi:polyferredoxin